MSQEQTAVEVVQNLPAQIQEVVQSFPQVSQAEQIAAKYAYVMGKALEIGREVANLERGNPEHLQIAKRARIELGKVNGAAEKLKKADKEGLLIQTRYIDSLYNATVGASKLIQNEAEAIENHFELMEQQRIEKLRAERMAQLEPYLEPNAAPIIGLATIDQDVWPLYLERAKKQFEELQATKAEADAEAKAAKEAELAKGDADKVQDLIDDLQALKIKYTFTSERYQKMYAQVGVLIEKTVTFINQ